MVKMKVAFATNDGNNFMSNHFGDAEYYHIYEIDGNGATYLNKIDNTTEEEEEDLHADPKKAKGISSLLRQENVSVVVSKVFGPNIKRIKKNFVCIILKDKSIEEGVQKIIDNFKIIGSEWDKGNERKHLSL